MLSIKSTYLSGLIFFLSINPFCYASKNTMTPEETKAFYKEAYAHTVQNMHATKQDYGQYFSKDFVMYMDGKKYFYDDYVQFMMDLNKDSVSVKIDFKQMAAENESVATVHTTHVSKKDGREIYLDVLSFFTVHDLKFTSGHELTSIQSTQG